MAFNVSRAVEKTITDPVESVSKAGRDVSKGSKHIGKQIADNNPLKKVDTKLPGVGDAPQPIERPTFQPSQVQIGNVDQAVAGQINYSPTGQTIDTTQQQQFRDQQIALMKQLQQQATGQGPSLAAQQLREGTEANIAAQQAALATARGGASPAMARQIGQQAAQLRAQEAAKAAQLRIQEQLNAQNALGTLTQQGRQQDIGLATDQARLDQATEKLKADLATAGAQMSTNTAIANTQVQAQLAMEQGRADIAIQGLETEMAKLEAQIARGDQQALQEYNTLKYQRGKAQAVADAEAKKAQQKMAADLIEKAAGVGVEAATKTAPTPKPTTTTPTA